MAAVLTESTADSRRFGLAVFRGRVDESTPPEAIANEIRVARPDVVIFRCPAGHTTSVRHLLAEGHTPIHADTLVHYSCRLGHQQQPRPPAGVSLQLAAPRDAAAIADVPRRGFQGYRSHYSANPLFDPERVLDGYVEWALAYAVEAGEDRETWVVRLDGKITGFATCGVDPKGASVAIVLNAVHPDFRGNGLYGSLLQAIVCHYGNAGFSSLEISTQIWNYIVQRAWCRAGLAIRCAFDTYHVNTMLRHTGGTQDV